MTVRIITVMCWVIILMMWMPETWFSGTCSILCHNKGCGHAETAFGTEDWYSIAYNSTEWTINLLKQGKGSSFYRWANLIAYFVLLPGLAVVNARLHSIQGIWYKWMGGSIAMLLAIGEVTSESHSLTGKGWYYYCTDWCIRVGNSTGLTYGGVCFVVFVVGIPGVLLGDFIWGVSKRLYLEPNEQSATES